jgi:O-antigen ligase
VLLFVAGWALFAFAGIYRWTAVPLTVGVALLVFTARPRMTRHPFRALDLALLASGLAVALQLVPLPAHLRLAVAPSVIAYEQAVRIAPDGATLPTLSGPITIDPDATRYGLLLIVLMVAVFWSARALFQRGGVRTTIVGIATMGLVVAPMAIGQHASAPRLFYWVWRGLGSNSLPYTPFINRNDFAGWLVMAIPLTLGYAVARIQSRPAGEAFDPESALDNKGLLLIMSLFAMTAGLIASLSRSGMAGLAAGLLVFILLVRERMDRKQTAWMLASLAAMVALATMYTNMGALANRMSGVVSEGMAGRLAIWRQTWPMVRDFFPLGSGVGTYQRIMVLYQTTSRLFFISHADNEYLQVLAEGGALLGVPVAIVLIAGATNIGTRLRGDRTPLFCMRAGAACGIVGVAVQNLWEMTLRIPANGVLFGILAAVALHETRVHGADAHRGRARSDRATTMGDGREVAVETRDGRSVPRRQALRAGT